VDSLNECIDVVSFSRFNPLLFLNLDAIFSSPLPAGSLRVGDLRCGWCWRRFGRSSAAGVVPSYGYPEKR